MKTTKYNKGVKKVALCMALGCFLLFFMGGNLVAQNDPQFVIKKGDNYLAHVREGENYVLRNSGTFNPATCLWYSGNTANVYGLHHNYYFIDHSDNYRFLAAPLQASGQLSLSATLPSIQLLRNTDQIYYFYDWDPDTYGAGVARGHKHVEATNMNDCSFSWSDPEHPDNGECWEVYWVEYDNGTWELSAASSYNIPTNGARYRSVSITEHDEEISEITSGLLPELADFTMEFNTSYDPSISISIPSSVTAGSYTPAYTTYVFEGGTHNYYGGLDHGSDLPGTMEDYSGDYVSLEWTITGEGAYYLSFDEGEYEVNSSSSPTPTIYYKRTNTTGHHTATLTLVVTYRDEDGNLATQERTATISLRSECINPGQPANPVVTYEGVTVSWYPTASRYRVYLTTDSETWTDYYDEVEDVSSYTFTGLAYNTHYYYKVVAYCGGEYVVETATPFEFKTKGEAGLLVYGAIFGGGRMADVGGNTEVVVINCDSVHAVYGGNDIAGTVSGGEGATITLGVNENDPNTTYDDYGHTTAALRIGDVYGGGNGYYAYDGASFVPASYDTRYTIAPDASIYGLTIDQQLGDAVWTNTSGVSKVWVCPTIKKTAITVTNDSVRIDSLFGGAKNAILNETGTDVDIKIHGGTIFTVYGGNNYGGSLGYHAHEHILVTNTSTKTDDYYYQILGRDFGIGYLFGGGNKVQGQHVDITVEGGQIDTIFGGGNAADVRSTVVRMQCALGAFNETTGAYGKVYTEALNSTYSSGDLTNDVIDTDYKWDRSGIYNVRTLFGGNNRASMEGVPSLLLSSGSIGTVYGGGNEGDMLAQEETIVVLPNAYGSAPVNSNVKYGTHVQMNSPNILIDFLYGGCQKSNVDYSTLTEIMGGHVGTVYGGCNVSGDVGSTRVNPNASSPSEAYQEVQGGTYVKASGGVIHGSLFGGSNGFYHCNNGISYIEGVNYCPPENYVGLTIPTHNETHVIVTGNAMIKKNVYAGGNMSPVGFTDATVGDRTFPQFVGLASVRMDGGEVVGNVFGGGNMASILGGNEVIVSGGSIGMTDDYDGALYGGNDRSGQVGQISNRVFPETYNVASDGNTSLTDVNTYVSLTGKPFINTVYGGGNGDYDYVDGDDVIHAGDYCSYDDETGEFNDKPIQTNTFVDINITGNDNDGHEGGHINTVYGGGNGVTVYGSITVFLNVVEPESYDHVGTIFGGNNKDNVVEFENVPLVPDIILLHGQVGTVYGGCNRGAMTTGKDFTIGGKTYQNVGSMVRLRSSYQATSTAPVVTPDAVVSKAVYGGCRMTDVYYNSLVLVESGEHPATLYGGSDISGTVGGTSQVVVTGGSIGGDVYGGGNGFYDYSSDYPGLTAPYCSKTYVEVSGGTCSSNVFGGGYAGECGETYVLVDGGTVNSKVFGGGNEAGVLFVENESTGNSTIVMNGGSVGTGMYGGCNAEGSIAGDVAITLTGGTIGTDEHPADVHGGGYGQPTTVAGNVLINFGQTMWDESGETPVEIHNENLNLYGDLYGGSALGNVNTDDENTTTIHIDNGTIHGNTYGGGLGDKASLGGDHTDVEAKVFGKVYVIVGGTDGAATPTFFGKASFDNGSIFGCNNLNGSPQANVFVDVYQTNHTEKDEVEYIASDRKYAIYQLFGGGNKADYAPENGYASSTCSTNVYIHGCENTIEDVFGGSNAANSNSAHTIVEGGRFDYIFGGGNGLVSPANVGTNPDIHHTYSQIQGGRVGWCFGGSNRQGNCINIEQDLETVGSCGELIIDYFFQGGNQADQYGEMLLTLDCSEAKKYLAAYGGCRLGTVYGNITVIMTGGTIGSLFGGNQGDEDHPAHVKRFPTQDELDNASPGEYSQQLIDFINTQIRLGKDWRGKGGNITVIVKGGAVGNLYGGCDTKGNVDGKITVIVESEDNDCGLFVGNVYGASNHTEYYPEDSDGISPKVNIIKATVGGSYDFNETTGIQPEEIFEGNVFGGGNVGEVVSNPKVIIGDGTTNKPVTIKGSVYGGGNDGNVVGNPQVLVDPDTHTLSVDSDHGTVTVGSNVPGSSYAVGEDVDINIVATAAPRYAFSYWEVSGDGASVGNTTLANTTFTMGTEDATLTAHYAPAMKLTLVADPAAGGTFKVNGVVYTEPIYVAPGTSVTVVATPAAGYNFNGWTVTGAGSSVTDTTTTTTHFTMGSEDAILKATFTEGRAYNDMNSNR